MVLIIMYHATHFLLRQACQNDKAKKAPIFLIFKDI